MTAAPKPTHTDVEFCIPHATCRQSHCTPLVPGQQHARQVVHVQHDAASSLVQAINTSFELITARIELR
jgi:hypothetical protein